MTRCVALMRGIGPGNPNMKNENYRRIAEGLGLQNVSTFISTGNVIFDTGFEAEQQRFLVALGPFANQSDLAGELRRAAHSATRLGSD